MGITENIKDKNNLAPYNAWTGSDYLKNVTDFSHHNNLKSSTDWSYNGERSLKLTRIAEEYLQYILQYFLHEATTQGNYKFTVKVYSPTTNGRIIIVLQDKDAIWVSYGVSNEIQTITLTITDSQITGFRFTVDTSLQTAYFDEISITHL